MCPAPRRPQRSAFTPAHAGFSLTPATAGFSLAEALVAAVFAAAGSVLLSHIRSSSQLELAQRQRDNAARLDYLIQVEASEAALVEQGRELPAGCEGAGQASIAAFRVPRDSGNYLDTVGNVSFIYFYNLDGAVRRCGPPVQRNGVHNHAAGLGLHDGVAVRDARIELVACQGQSTSSSQLAYRLVFPSGYQPACSIARARTIFIR